MNGSEREEISLGWSLTAIIVAVVAVSIVWAVYTSNIAIGRSRGIIHGMREGSWSILFTDLSSIAVGNTESGVSSVEERVAPSLSDSTISTFNVNMKTPGDWFAYRFKIRNAGTLDARIGTFTAVGSSYLTCEPAASSTITAERAARLCNHIRLSLRYVDGGKDVSSDDPFLRGEEKEVELRLVYEATTDASDLPTDDVSIKVSEISIPFLQV